MRRGEILWYTLPRPDKRRPVLLLTRSTVIDTLNEIVVAPATRTIRGLSTEVLLSSADGMPDVCALNGAAIDAVAPRVARSFLNRSRRPRRIVHRRTSRKRRERAGAMVLPLQGIRAEDSAAPVGLVVLRITTTNV